jgi:hypothetical protein
MDFGSSSLECLDYTSRKLINHILLSATNILCLFLHMCRQCFFFLEEKVALHMKPIFVLF